MMEILFALICLTTIWACVASVFAFRYWDEVGEWRRRYYRLRGRRKRERSHDTLRDTDDIFARFGGERTDKPADDLERSSDEGR
jgi:hypothetical protein